MFGNRDNNNDFNSFENELFYLKNIEKFMKFKQKVDFNNIMINKC